MPRLAVLCLGIALLAARPTAVSGQEPFRAQVDLLQLDVTVLDEDDRPVAGLTPDDFIVREDGELRPVVAFETIEAGPAASAGDVSHAPWLRDVPVDRASNDLSEGRLIVLVLDNAMTPAEPRIATAARAIATEVIDGLALEDRAAVVFTWQTARPQNFTTDRARLRDAVGRFTWGPYLALPPGLTVSDRPEFDLVDSASFTASLRTLRMVTQALIAVPNRRKIVVYVGSGVPVDPLKAELRTPDGSAAEALLHAGLEQELQDVFVRAARANVAVYTIDPAGNGGLRSIVFAKLLGWRALIRPNQTPGAGPRRSAQTGDDLRGFRDEANRKSRLNVDFLEGLAAGTGGRALFNSDNFEPAVARMFEDTSAYYLLGVTPADPGPDGRIGRIDVDTVRPDLKIRVRRGFENREAPDPDVPPVDREIVAALADLLPRDALGLQAVVTPVAPTEDGRIAAAVMLDVTGTATVSSASQPLRLIIGAFSPTGREIRTDQYRLEFSPGAGRGTESVQTLSAVEISPGDYEVRIAAEQSTGDGRSGSVFYDFDLDQMPDSGMWLSGVFLIEDSGREASLRLPPDVFADVLPDRPTARRRFSQADRVHARLLLYAGDGSAIGPVEVRAVLLDDSGLSQFDQIIPVLRSSAGAGTPAAVEFDLPVGALDRGEYLLRVTVPSATGNIERQVRFRVG